MKRTVQLELALGLTLASIFGLRADADDDLKPISSPDPPAGTRNQHYASNREPLTESPLVKLPTGSIRPQGWLRRQLELMRDGMIGHLPEVSKWCQIKESAWANPKGEGQYGWEELPYWLKGFVNLGYVLGDERIQREAKAWIEGALSSQEESGYFGPRENKAKDDVWPNMVMINALQDYQDATGDPRVIPFLLKYFKWELDLPREKLLPGSWQKIRGGDNLASVYWVYNRTGEKWLLDLATKIHERTAPWVDDIQSWHGVNICQSFREPAVFYQQSADPLHLRAAERNYRKVIQRYGQVPGGMFGADENCRPGFSGPRQGAETCSMVEFMFSFEMLLGISGRALFADRCEEVAFNSLPASQTADLKALHYLTAPNLVQCDKENKSPAVENEGCMLAFSPGEQYRCCQHNVSHGWPYFAEHLWMATRGNGLAATLYAPCEVEALVADGVKVKIVETTDYPFDGTVRLKLAAPKSVLFPLALRIPIWCRGPSLSLNGKRINVRPSSLTYLTLERIWADGDQLQLELPMKVGVRSWPSSQNAISVHRGPLTFSLKIGERWQRCGGTDKWPELELFPTTPWNYGLIVDKRRYESSFEVVKKEGPLPAQPFDLEAAPVLLKAKAKRIPAWKMAGGLVGNLQPSPVKSDERVEEITLIPMGCARLRIAAFPVIGDGARAHEWKEPPRAPQASHIHDNVQALVDGILPKSSKDQEVPRFTWWDHLGTKEWVSITLDKPKKISSAEVYWFDDTGAGRCRAPKSWRLLWKDAASEKDKGEWRPVSNPSVYGVDLDKLNKVTFDPVEASEVRLETELQEGFSGGILEWRVE
jgi:hypothetical protein